jgi:transposase InsO family protein
MQIKALHRNVYKLYRYARTQECLEACRAFHTARVTGWRELKQANVEDAVCRKVTGVSRSSFYRSQAALKRLAAGKPLPSKARKRQNKRQWGEAEMQLVLRVRRENPTYGRAKIAVILKRDHDRTLSPSTVGRILTHLAGKGLVGKSGSAPRPKRTRDFRKGHAGRWTYKLYADMVLGERVQIDHMTVTRNGVVCKHFQAWERKSKFIHAQIYGHAKSSSAAKFLRDLVEAAPFKILSIQVDGGSELMAEFEQTCAELAIPLIVLPPSRPKYNGGVERGNRTFREELYNRPGFLDDSLGAIRISLRKALDKYNAYRPHHALNGLTPRQYLQALTPQGNAPSQTA